LFLKILSQNLLGMGFSQKIPKLVSVEKKFFCFKSQNYIQNMKEIQKDEIYIQKDKNYIQTQFFSKMYTKHNNSIFILSGHKKLYSKNLFLQNYLQKKVLYT